MEPPGFVKTRNFHDFASAAPMLATIEHDDIKSTVRRSKANSYTCDLKDQSFGPPLCFFCYESRWGRRRPNERKGKSPVDDIAGTRLSRGVGKADEGGDCVRRY